MVKVFLRLEKYGFQLLDLKFDAFRFTVPTLGSATFSVLMSANMALSACAHAFVPKTKGADSADVVNARRVNFVSIRNIPYPYFLPYYAK